jgi:hypothetical protein
MTPAFACLTGLRFLPAACNSRFLSFGLADFSDIADSLLLARMGLYVKPFWAKTMKKFYGLGY